MNILLFGPPGAGKGTQSSLLKEKLGMLHVSTGDLFRENIRNKTDLGIKAKEIIDRGELVPDDITIGMVESVFSSLSGKDFILDGFPRTVAQAEALERLLATKNLELGKAIFIDVDKKDLLSRLTGRRVCESCGEVFHIEAKPSKVEGVCDSCNGKLVQRKDDSTDVITTRLEAYERSTSPVIDYYKQTGKYAKVDGMGDARDVFQRIHQLLAEK